MEIMVETCVMPERLQHTSIILYSYFMPVCSIVKTITPSCRGRPDALLHEVKGRGQ